MPTFEELGPTFDARVDYLVDTGVFCYRDAIVQVCDEFCVNVPDASPTPDALTDQKPNSTMREAQATPRIKPVARRGYLTVHGPQYGEEEGIGYPEGKPHYYQPDTGPLSAEQVVVNQSGFRLARDAITNARKRRNS